MRSIYLKFHAILLALSLLLNDKAFASQTVGYAGVFKATNPYTQGIVTLTLRSEGSVVRGSYTEADHDEATYRIEGTVVEGALKGIMTNEGVPLMKFKFTALLNNGFLLFQLDNSLWATIVPALKFSRQSNASSDGGIRSAGSSAYGGDNKILGTWVYTERYSSGDFYSSSREYMVFTTETIKMYEPVTSINDSQSSVSSGGFGKLVGTFGYLIEGNKIFVIHPHTGEKVFMCTFILQDGKLLTQVNGDSKKQLWEKVK